MAAADFFRLQGHLAFPVYGGNLEERPRALCIAREISAHNKSISKALKRPRNIIFSVSHAQTYGRTHGRTDRARRHPEEKKL